MNPPCISTSARKHAINTRLSSFCLILLVTLVSFPTRGEEVYRWRGPDGGVHFSDQQVPGARRLHIETAPARFHAIDWIPDGDTIHLANGEKVRLLGINSPEVAHREHPAEAGGDAARDFLRQWLKDKKVRLEYGPERKDKYRRSLAHVFLRDGTNVNAEMLRRGHAYAVPRPPNLAYTELYAAAEAAARESNRGLWSLARYGVWPAADARRFLNSFRRLNGTVRQVKRSRKYTYLHFAGGFQAYLPNTARPLFEQRLGKLERLKGRNLTVRGWVRKRYGKPIMRLRHPLDLENVKF